MEDSETCEQKTGEIIYKFCKDCWIGCTLLAQPCHVQLSPTFFPFPAEMKMEIPSSNAQTGTVALVYDHGRRRKKGDEGKRAGSEISLIVAFQRGGACSHSSRR